MSFFSAAAVFPPLPKNDAGRVEAHLSHSVSVLDPASLLRPACVVRSAPLFAARL
jgi:hypothetical protein